MAGLFLPVLPFADSVGQKIWITIIFCGVFFSGWICPFGALQDWIGWIAKKIHLPRFKLPQKGQQYAQLLRYFLYGLSTLNIVFYFLNSRFYFGHSVAVGLWDWVNGAVLILFLLVTLFTGQQFLMAHGFLERRVVTRNSLFNRQLTGKKQAFKKFIHWILERC